MNKTRGLFLVLNGLLSRCARTGRWTLAQGLEGRLKDFRAHGFRIIGILEDAPEGDVRLPFDFDEVWVGDDVSDTFAPRAWSLARRYSLNVRRSLLCSLNERHEGWVRDAGLKRFETPYGLFGL